MEDHEITLKKEFLKNGQGKITKFEV